MDRRRPRAAGDAQRGFTSVAVDEAGDKRRVRPESFADHYSQARIFFRSQTEVERGHIANALAFELGKVETPGIRLRVLASMRNADEDLAAKVADLLGVELPTQAPATVTAVDVPESKALSIVANAPGTFAGRKVGVLVSDGTSSALVDRLREALDAEGATLAVVAPRIAGASSKENGTIVADHAIAGAPSVLFDAVVLAPGRDAAALSRHPAVRAFVADSFAHCKFIGATKAARPMLSAGGIDEPDDGCIEIDTRSVGGFVKRCRELRFWDREATLGA